MTNPAPIYTDLPWLWEPDPGRKSVLIVERDPQSQAFIRQEVERSLGPCAIATAADVETALALLDELNFDLIIADHVLDGLPITPRPVTADDLDLELGAMVETSPPDGEVFLISLVILVCCALLVLSGRLIG